ncbi:hypothetical protein RN001_009951, partial [Aquatica leii]
VQFVLTYSCYLLHDAHYKRQEMRAENINYETTEDEDLGRGEDYFKKYYFM